MRSNRPAAVLIVLLTIMAIASFIINYHLFNLSRLYYGLFNRTRLDPLGLDAFPADQFQKQDIDLTRVVLFGDSRAAEWPLPEIPGFEFINRGLNSHTSNQLLLRYDAHIRSLNPDVLVVQVCINDLYAIPLFDDSGEVVVATCKNNIEQIVHNATEEGVVVVLTTIFPVGQVPIESKLFWSDEILLAVEEVNSFIRSLDGEEVQVFDAYSILATGNGRLAQEFSRDELHLNSAGYEALNREFIPFIESLNQVLHLEAIGVSDW